MFGVLAEIVSLENAQKGAYVDDHRAARRQSKGDSRSEAVQKTTEDLQPTACNPVSADNLFEADDLDDAVILNLSPSKDGMVSCEITPSRKRNVLDAVVEDREEDVVAEDLQRSRRMGDVPCGVRSIRRKLSNETKKYGKNPTEK